MVRLVLFHTIRIMQIAMTRLINRRGDIEVPEDQNPTRYTTAEGGSINLHSNLQENRHLTYQSILHSIDGLMEVLITQHRYYSVSFEIIEAGVGRIGGRSLTGPTTD